MKEPGQRPHAPLLIQLLLKRDSSWLAKSHNVLKEATFKKYQWDSRKDTKVARCSQRVLVLAEVVGTRPSIPHKSCCHWWTTVTWAFQTLYFLWIEVKYESSYFVIWRWTTRRVKGSRRSIPEFFILDSLSSSRWFYWTTDLCPNDAKLCQIHAASGIWSQSVNSTGLCLPNWKRASPKSIK